MEILRLYALQFVGTPYHWGGSNPMEGFDCSGFIQELLASVGEDPPGDQSAQALFDYYRDNGRSNEPPGVGCLVFYGTDHKHITHVAMMIDNYRVIEAGGGDSSTTTFERAKEQGAYVRVRLMNRRRDIVAVIKPQYVKIGMI